MKITVLQKDLIKTLISVSRFVSVRSQLPILTNIKLKAKNSKLIAQATNLEMSCSSSIGAQVEKTGEVAVNARVLVDLVNSLKSERLCLFTEGESLKLESEGFKSVLSGLNTSDFPLIPDKFENGVKLPKEEFFDGLASTIFSCSLEPSRPALSGVLFIFGENVDLVASDGFRLSKKIIKAKTQLSSRFIVPKNVLVELLRLSSDIKTIGLELNEEERQVIFVLDETVISSRLIEGDYPPFEKIIPKNSSISVSLNKDDFKDAIKTASVFARDAANIVTLEIKEDLLKVSAKSANFGYQESIVSAKVEGPDITVPYNYRFIEDFLNVVKGESIFLKFNGTTSPGVFLDASDESFLHLIMPVKS